MSENKVSSRRDFLKASTAAAAGAALASHVNIARTAHAAGSDQIKVALIGCGGRGNGAIRDCLGADPGVKVIAVADAFEDRAKGTANSLKKEFPDRVDLPADRVFSGLDAYQKAIASGADMIVTATPPGFRPLLYSAAIKAGKHVFMEKPCCVDAAGYRTLMEANTQADSKGLKVGVGFQRRHTTPYHGDGQANPRRRHRHDHAPAGLLERRGHLEQQAAAGHDRAGVPGPQLVPLLLAFGRQHLRAARPQPGRRQLAMAQDGDPKKAHPVEANGMGGCTPRYPGDQKGTGQIFDHHFVEYTYADGTKMFSQCRHMPNTWGNVSEAVHGTKGEANCAGWIKGETSGTSKAGATTPWPRSTRT